jgi:hypothetical protein
MKVPRDAQKPNPGPGAKYGSVYFVSQRVIPNPYAGVRHNLDRLLAKQSVYI